MNRLFLSLSVLLFLVHGQSIAQKPGDARWSVLTDASPGAGDTIHSIRVQPDGKIVAAGTSYKGGSYLAITLGRYDGESSIHPSACTVW